MQTIQLKNSIISWVAALNDKKLVGELYQWVMSKEKEDAAAAQAGFVPPRRTGKLTEGYGIWADDTAEDITGYRKNIWQTEKNIW
ncbi:MAG: hypothetical protein LBB79_00390 [Prevotellaceae bacterium]|nr:hypothetical protein [Prevotellaceae bacterium]